MNEPLTDASSWHRRLSENRKAESEDSGALDASRGRAPEQSAEDELRDSQARLAGIVDSAMDATY